eukprot:scaffold46850_cov27-Phaeocystis_antarctica.AAC.2
MQLLVLEAALELDNQRDAIVRHCRHRALDLRVAALAVEDGGVEDLGLLSHEAGRHLEVGAARWRRARLRRRQLA